MKRLTLTLPQAFDLTESVLTEAGSTADGIMLPPLPPNRIEFHGQTIRTNP